MQKHSKNTWHTSFLAQVIIFKPRFVCSPLLRGRDFQADDPQNAKLLYRWLIRLRSSTGSFDRYRAGPISIILCWICLLRLVSNAFAWNHHSTDVGQAKKLRNTTAGLTPVTSLSEDVSAECGSRPYVHQWELTALERRHTNNKGHNNNDIYARHGSLTLNWFLFYFI